MLLPFTKMHGLGNDFVVFDAISHDISLDFTPILCQKIAHRNLGIGCDQIMLLSKSQDQHSDFHCRIFNADGSEAGMSGNGLRCLAKLIVENNLTIKETFHISTYSRNVEIYVKTNNPQENHVKNTTKKIVDITLNLGYIDLDPQKIPLATSQQKDIYTIKTEFGDFTFGAVSVGNPHAVVLIEDITQIDIAKIGKAISLHNFFPEHTNVNFMQILDKSNIKLRTYERGTGETLACGSGSSASVAIGRLWNLLDPTVNVHLHYGNLQITLHDIQSPLLLTGNNHATKKVFSGIIDISELIT